MICLIFAMVPGRRSEDEFTNEKLNSIGPFQRVLDEVFLMGLLLVKLERLSFQKVKFPIIPE